MGNFAYKPVEPRVKSTVSHPAHAEGLSTHAHTHTHTHIYIYTE